MNELYEEICRQFDIARKGIREANKAANDYLERNVTNWTRKNEEEYGRLEAKVSYFEGQIDLLNDLIDVYMEHR